MFYVHIWKGVVFIKCSITLDVRVLGLYINFVCSNHCQTTSLVRNWNELYIWFESKHKVNEWGCTYTYKYVLNMRLPNFNTLHTYMLWNKNICSSSTSVMKQNDSVREKVCLFASCFRGQCYCFQFHSSPCQTNGILSMQIGHFDEQTTSVNYIKLNI